MKEELQCDREQGEIGRELSSLSTTIEKLEDIADIINDRLGPILYNQSTANSPEGSVQQASTIVGGGLQEYNRRIYSVVQILQSINERNAL